MTNSVNLPAPYAGVKQQIPKAALQSPYCENLLNFNVTQAGISLRHGDAKYKAYTNRYGCRLVAYGNTKLFFATLNASTAKDEVYDVVAGTIVYTSAAATGTTEFFDLYFNKYLFLFVPGVASADYPGLVYDGTNWGIVGYTGTGFAPNGGAVFNSRAYIIQSLEAAYWYTGINQVTGALPAKVDLSGIITENARLIVITPITIADNVSAVTLLAFVFDSGEVLFYSGSYPDASDWGITGRAFIGRPISTSSCVKYQGDALILTNNGVVSLRDLFLKGSEDAANLTVNSNIQETWTALTKAILALGYTPYNLSNIKGIWDRGNDRIIIAFPFYLSAPATVLPGTFYFIFDCVLQSWSFQRSMSGDTALSLSDIVNFSNKVYSFINYTGGYSMILEKEGSTGFMDRRADDTTDVAYSYEMLSAPIPFPKTAVYEATQIEPIMQSDLYAQTNWNFVVDFGRQTSGNQPTDAITTSVAKPAVNVGMQNITYVQVKMSGTTTTGKTVGLDLYSYNVWYNHGEVASR